MRGKPPAILAAAVTAITMTAAGLLGTTPAQAAPAAAARVPCSVTALTLALSSISGGEELSLARNCTYLLTQCLPVVTEDLTIWGERVYPGAQ
jgi:hypothetical protein